MENKPKLVFISRDDLFGGFCDPPLGGYAFMTSSDERATKLFESLKEMGMSITPNPSDKNELWAKVINDCKEKALFVAGSFPSISNDIIIQLKEKYDLVYTQSVSDVRKALTESLGVSPSDENRKIGYY